MKSFSSLLPNAAFHAPAFIKPSVIRQSYSAYLDGANATVTNSTVSGNGSLQYGYSGGIYNYGKSNLTLTNSTVSNNSAVAGGGIYNDGDVDHNLTATAASAKVASTSNSVHI
jgi:hypothetical protein